MKFLCPLLLALALLTGCAAPTSARKVVPLDSFQRIFVVQNLNDNHRVDELFVAELRRLGRDASSGPRTMMPEKTDAVLTYTDRWEWDFKKYLIELNLEVHTAHTHKKLADARYYHPSIRSEKPEVIVADLVGRLFR